MKQRRLWKTKQEWGHWSFSTTEIVLIFQIRKPREGCFKKTCWETMVNVQPNEKQIYLFKQQLHHYIIWYSFCLLLSSKYGFKYYILIIILFYCIIIIDILLLKKSGLQLKKPKLFNFYQLKIILFISYKLATLCNGVATGSFCI